MNKNKIRSLFDEWNSGLETGDKEVMAAFYAPSAILLPTISNQIRYNHEEIKDYFVQFLDRGPKGMLNESNVRIFDDLAINSGIYTFSFSNGESVQARFTFIYQWNGEEWKIIEHHSSQMPED